MKIIFVNVSKFWGNRIYKEYPYGVGLLATIAHNAGYEVKIFDMALETNQLFSVIQEFKPQIVALSFMSPSAQKAFEIIPQIRNIHDGHIISGGIHTTLYPEQVIEKGIDIGVMGEAEDILLPLLHYLETHQQGQYYEEELSTIPSLIFKEDNSIKRTVENNKSVNINQLPIINRSLYNLNLYNHHTILTSRRCPYSCNFCCSWAPGGSTARMMSNERIFDELDYLIKTFGEIDLYWGDEIFFWTNKQRMNFLEQLSEKKLPIHFTAQLRADLITKPLIHALLKCGCDKISIGAESGSDFILKTANKKITAEQIETGINESVLQGMRTKTWWIIGLPGGTMEDQLSSLKLIERTMPHEVAIHQFTPLPGSHFWDNAEKYGIILPNESDFGNLSYYESSEQLKTTYLTQHQLGELFSIYEQKLMELGYIPSDLATADSKYVFTSPSQKSTFRI